MEIELHCMMCGGILAKGGECQCCGAEYSNVLVSESIPFDGSEPTEVSISMEGIFTPKKPEIVVPFEMHSAVEETVTV